MRFARLPAIFVLAIALVACGADQGPTDAPAAADPAVTAAASAPPEADVPANEPAAADANMVDPARFELDMARVDRWLDATRDRKSVV